MGITVPVVTLDKASNATVNVRDEEKGDSDVSTVRSVKWPKKTNATPIQFTRTEG